MLKRKPAALAVALVAAFGVAPIAAAFAPIADAYGPSSPPPLSESQMQGLSNGDPTWHPLDKSTVTLDASGHRVESTAMPPPRDYLILPDDATNTMTPAEASHITGHVDSSAGPPLNGSQEQPGNMGPNSSKGE